MTIRVNVREVGIVFSAIDHSNHLVQNLSAQDVTVLDNGMAAAVTSIEPVSDLPVHLALLVDTSDSVQRQIEEEIDAAAAFVGRILRPEYDQLAVFSFGSSVREYDGGSIAAMRASLSDRQRGGLTVLYDAMVRGCSELTARESEGRRVVLLLTDGEDTVSRHSQSDMVEAAKRSGAVVFPILMRKGTLSGERAMKELAEQTGGRAFSVSHPRNLAPVFDQIEREIRAQYRLSFRPTLTGPAQDFHQVSVRTRQQGIRIHAPAGYLIP